MKKTLLITALSLTTLFYSCEGPVGPAGPAGLQGPAGTNGAKGDKGDPGNPAGAIQLSTGGITSNENGAFALSWSLGNNNPKVIEKGVVNTYIKSQGAWFQVPGMVLLTQNALAQYFYGYEVDATKIYVNFFQMADPIYNTTLKKVTFEDIRVVIVPAMNTRLNGEINWSSYEEVRKTFNLPE